MSREFVVRREGVELRGEVAGEGEPVLLFLHGLAGYGREWASIVGRCGHDRQVVLFDQRGHGASSRRPPDMSRQAFVGDAVAVAATVGGGRPVWLVGQSLGGHTAFLTAVQEPELVAGLVVVEATPQGPDPGLLGRIERWLESWPRPFATRSEAVGFFGAGGGEVWADGLEVSADGLWPRFDDDMMLAALAEIAARSWWEEWSQLRCPTLVIRGDRGWIGAETAERMAAAAAVASVVTIDDAGHDVHLDNGDAFVEALEAFLDARRGPRHDRPAPPRGTGRTR